MWRRRARLAIGAFALVFLVLLVFAFKRRQPPSTSSGVVGSDPKAVAETTGGQTQRFKSSREDVNVRYDKLVTYADGSSKLLGITIHTENRGGRNRTFTVTGREGRLGQRESTIVLDGDVRLASSDGMSARAEHATYTDSDGVIDAPGPVDFSRGRMAGTGVGLKYDKAKETVSILDQAVVHVAADDKGTGAGEITAGSAVFAQRDKYIQFDRSVRIQRGGQTIEADTAIARLSADDKRIETLELHNHARIAGTRGGPGSLRGLTGADMTLTYAADGETLQRALIAGDASVEVAGDAGTAGRQIAAKLLDIGMGPDGSTPVSLMGREAVQLVFPADATTPARTIRAAIVEATGEPGRGLTRATFTGDVQFRERGAQIERAASANTLELVMKPGLGAIDEARFVHAVRFEEGKMTAQAAAARYDLSKGTLDLSGSEPSFATPRVVNEQIAVDATRIEIVLEGPQVNATGSVKSTLQPASKAADAPAAGRDPGGDKRGGTKLPAILKQDRPVSVVADKMSYDGGASSATYTGGVRLFQGDTTIKADTITIDEKRGDLTASGHAMTTTTREQTGKDNKKQRTQSTATAKDLKYEDSLRRLTYTGGAHLVGPEGDLSAAKIELYFRPDGDEVERAEAYGDATEKMTLREQNRTTTGLRMTYTADQEQYVVTGLPATVIDECARETIGRTLTFTKATDTIVVDGNQQIRTQTKGGSATCK